LFKEDSMTKKSLVFGAAALALLVLLTIVGCSNPSSGSTEYVTQAGSDYPYPADTVRVATRGALDGLLNDYTAETNQVRNIAFTGNTGALGLASPLIIPAGKTVYLTDNHTTPGKAGNITVREGAKLVLVGNFTAGNGDLNQTGPNDNDTGFLLVKGQLEVFRNLTVTNDARDVSDYTIENNIEVGRNTVIGRNVTILPGATLTLDKDDIIPPLESQNNKFTPAEAWAAAGQGNLVIGNTASTPGVPAFGTSDADTLTAYSYTVAELLTGVNPGPTRSYTVTSGRITAEELPAVIPQGAYILTRAIPSKSVGNTLTVNGSLTTFGTLSDITKIEVGNGGSLTLTENNGELLQALVDLKLGPGADFAVTSNDISLKALETLFLGDGSLINIPGTGVTFKEDNVLGLTIGKDVTYKVVMSPSATVNTVISKDASLVGGSTLVVYPGSTFTVDEGVTFTVDGVSTFDISRQAVPAADAAPAIAINGAVNVAEGSTFVAPYASVATNPAVLYQTVGLGAKGKVALDYGAQFRFGRALDAVNQLYVGVNGSTATYEWDGSTDGAEIELNAGGVVIRDTDATLGATVAIAAPGAVILKSHELYLDRNVTLDIGADIITLQGDTDANGGGAKLLGPGKLTAGGITISGGDDGWQVLGDNIEIDQASTALTAVSAATPVSATFAATFKALGLGASIDVAAGGTLIIAADTTIDLNGTMARKNGEILLAGTAVISLTDNDSVILTGAGPAGHTAGVPLDTGGASLVTTALDTIGVANLAGDGADALAVTTAVPVTTAPVGLPAGRLVSLTGTTSGSSGTATAGAAVRISSETVTAAF
jgi:hypothetical protein